MSWKLTGLVIALAGSAFVATTAQADLYDLNFRANNGIDYIQGTVLLDIDTSNNITSVIPTDTVGGVTTTSTISFWINGQTPTLVPVSAAVSGWDYNNKFTGNLSIPFDYYGPLFAAGTYHVNLYDYNGDNYLSTDYTGFAGNSWYNPGQPVYVEMTPYGVAGTAPEISTWAMLGLGFLCTASLGYRQRKLQAITA